LQSEYQKNIFKIELQNILFIKNINQIFYNYRIRKNMQTSRIM